MNAQEMLNYCARHGIASDVEVIPIRQLNQAYDRIVKSDVCYRFVIDLASLKEIMGGMEHEKIIFFRNFFFRAFIVGLAFALFYFFATWLFWNTATSWATYFFKIDEKELGRLILLFFIQLRVVLVFFFLVPALAFHWMSRKR